MNDLRFYILFNSISVTNYVRVIMMELFFYGWKDFPTPGGGDGGNKPGMDNLSFHVL